MPLLMTNVTCKEELVYNYCRCNTLPIVSSLMHQLDHLKSLGYCFDVSMYLNLMLTALCAPHYGCP